ncbi:DUF167 domain-containing protein [Rhizobacter sp. Root404]|uniref:DUF167 domain-containing protein n=1 Tax=Rhizobacter sp. Root404 TaxID=1736528 RepID=UPI0006FCBBDC|nr:DUF167 domain-containing protein [Rhizobacter sp. Root404]KQW38856.1 hypothetical protein ASC76_12895 [Rhizobacter sp. Root404]
MTAGWPCLSVHGQMPWLAVSVQPNAKRTAADGLHDGTLRVRLGAPPVDGKANQLLIDWLAGELGLPKRAVTLVRGDTSRRKWLAIDAPLGRIEAWLAANVTAGTSPTPSPPVR